MGMCFMTQRQAKQYMLRNPHCHVGHVNFQLFEYLYAKEDGCIYDEVGNLFEDFKTNEHNGLRVRCGYPWLTGWYIITGPEYVEEENDNVTPLHKLLLEWGVDNFMSEEYVDHLVAYLVSNRVKIDG